MSLDLARISLFLIALPRGCTYIIPPKLSPKQFWVLHRCTPGHAYGSLSADSHRMGARIITG